WVGGGWGESGKWCGIGPWGNGVLSRRSGTREDSRRPRPRENTRPPSRRVGHERAPSAIAIRAPRGPRQRDWGLDRRKSREARRWGAAAPRKPCAPDYGPRYEPGALLGIPRHPTLRAFPARHTA